MKISIVGTGYVGLVAGVCFAKSGHCVICVDINDKKIAMLKEGRVPIYEPGLEELMHAAVQSGRLHFTTQMEEALESTDILFIAVGTPEMSDGSAQISPILSIIKNIVECPKAPPFIVLKSTVPPGTAHKIQKYLNTHSLKKIEIINNPEFLKEGAAIDDFLKPDRVVIGHNSKEAKAIMQKIYHPIIKNPIYFMDNTSAELTKYAANAFLSVKISFINELAHLSDKLGADINKVKQGFTSDRRIHPTFFNPGLGYGGSCFPKDIKALIHTAKENDLKMRVISAAKKVNDEQRTLMFARIQKRFKNLSKLKIAIWGISFKPQTDDTREAPSLYIIKSLLDAGAQITAFDPIAGENARRTSGLNFQLATHALKATENADALVICTEWSEFCDVNIEQLKSNLKQPIIFDGRNIFDPKTLTSYGFEYHCVGRQELTKGDSA